MVTFLYVLGLFILLITFGVSVSLYLYHWGAIGKKRSTRSRSLLRMAFTTVEDDYE